MFSWSPRLLYAGKMIRAKATSLFGIEGEKTRFAQLFGLSTGRRRGIHGMHGWGRWGAVPRIGRHCRIATL